MKPLWTLEVGFGQVCFKRSFEKGSMVKTLRININISLTNIDIDPDSKLHCGQLSGILVRFKH